MNVRAVWIVFSKEILDIIRDRRTFIFMIIMPLVLIPGLFYMMSKFQISSRENMATKNSVVAVIGAEDAPTLIEYLLKEQRERYAATTEDESINAFIIESRSGVNAFLRIVLEDNVEDVQRRIREKDIDAALVIPPGFESDLFQTDTSGDDGDETAITWYPSDLSLRIDYVSTNDFSEKAYQRLVKSLNLYRESVVSERLIKAGYDESLIKPWSNERGDLATQQERSGRILGALLPYLIILMTFAGATFPAIQLGAGEKEQKTLETLLASPVGRAEMVTGKFLTIMLTGIISAALSMAGLYYSFTFMGSGIGMTDVLSMHFDTLSLTLAFLLVVPLTLVFAGILLALSVLARSFREAQGYIGPLNMFVILPAFASLLPGVELNYGLAMAPIVNVSLVLRQILAGRVMEVLPYYLVTVASTLVLAIISILFCAYLFRREQAIFKI
jgi:sodium transport system permease protein